MRDTDFSKLENVVKEKRVLLISDWFLFNFEMLDKLAEAKESYKISPYQFDKVDKFLVSDELKAGDVVVSFAGVGKDVGNKKILEGEKYRLKYKDLIFYGWKSYEVYERY